MKKFYIAYLFLGTYVLKANAQCGITFPNPVANFSNTEVCQGNATSFDATSSTIASPDSIVSYQWDFGGVTASGITQGYILPISGAQSITLKVISSNGCADSITKTCNVNPLPQVDFTISIVSVGQSTLFQNLSSISNNPPGSNIATYTWDFTSDGLIDAVAFNVSFIYPDSGNYTATLCAYSNMNCHSCTSQTVQVNSTNVGINFPSDNSTLNIYPNPVNDKLFISLKNNATSFSVKIFNELGQEVLSNQTSVWQNNISKSIDVSKLNLGVYFVQVNCDGKVYSKKISKY